MSLVFDEIFAARAAGRLQIIPDHLLVVAYQPTSDTPPIRVDLLEFLSTQDTEIRRLRSDLTQLTDALQRFIRTRGRS